jgi:hypothetical protein
LGNAVVPQCAEVIGEIVNLLAGAYADDLEIVTRAQYADR